MTATRLAGTDPSPDNARRAGPKWLRRREGRTGPARAARLAVLTALLAVTGCGERTPGTQDDLCAVFDQHPSWYDYAEAAQSRWGTPIPVLMAFVQFESGFRETARPPRRYLLGFIPWRWETSAYGYAQAKDATWTDYLHATPDAYRKRTDMEDALDFVGWYNHRSVVDLGLARDDAVSLYLAYHEGHAGYRRGDWRQDPDVRRYAARVAARAQMYRTQLQTCESRFQCWHWYEFGPFCDAGDAG